MSLGSKNSCLEFFCSNTVGKAAIHVAYHMKKRVDTKVGGVMAGGREIPPSLWENV